MARGWSFIAGAVLLSLAGCASVTRDTWSGADAQLQQTHITCLEKSNGDAIQADNGAELPTAGGGGTFGRALRRKMYKSCMEKAGYTKIRTEEDASVHGGVCGSSDQTCTRDPSVFNPMGYRRAY